VFFLVRVLDTPLDPILGHWMDATRTRWGRFRPWLVGGGLALMLSTAMVFFARPGVSIYYLFGWVMLLYAGHSMVNVAHMAWGATFSPDYNQRSRVYSYWIAGQMLGLITVLILPALTAQTMGGGAPKAVHVMGGFVLAVIPLAIGWAVLGAPEGRLSAPHPAIHWGDVKRMLSSPALRLLLVSDVLVSLSPGVTGALFRFIFEKALGFTSGESAVMLLLYFISGLVFLPMWLGLAVRIGKQRAAAVAALAGASLHVGAYLVFDPGNVALSYAAIALAGIPYAAPGFLLRAMLADFGDEEKLAGGADRIGLLNAVLTTAQKIGYALPVGLLFPALTLVGFDADPVAVNTVRSMEWLEAFWLALPPLLLLPAALLLMRIPLGAERLAAVQAALAKSTGSH
jgi:Na+/melibiose symporter-like transporter